MRRIRTVAEFRNDGIDGARERERTKDKLPSENDWPQNVICILHIS
jgi:hypothetical protein